MADGILFKASQLGLDSTVLNFQEQKERIVFGTRELARLKALEKYTMRKAAALEILVLNNPINDLSVKELKALMHYKKRKDDGAVPNKKMIFWKGMRPSVDVHIKHLRRIYQDFGITVQLIVGLYVGWS